jgi:hypothetical protein
MDQSMDNNVPARQITGPGDVAGNCPAMVTWIKSASVRERA